ncbi:unnamed protein product [Effrenium voratum]|nr:unnamed protein product [Effrenium voratum]
MIRTHEGDSSVRFQDFARLMLRQDRPATPRSVSSGYRSATPRSEAMFAPRSPASSSAPFATWDVQSQASQATESSRRRQVEPPYATGEAQPSHAERLPGRDILGWNHAPSREEAQGPLGRRHVAASSGQTFLHWPAEGVQEAAERPGRRLYGPGLSASESAPFGRSSDVSRYAPELRMATAPFGTDQDLGLRRPEDAGTDEYRAVQGLRR